MGLPFKQDLILEEAHQHRMSQDIDKSNDMHDRKSRELDYSQRARNQAQLRTPTNKMVILATYSINRRNQQT